MLKHIKYIELACYLIAAFVAIELMLYNLNGRFVVEHSEDDGHNHIEELSAKDLILKADQDSTNSELQLNVARVLWQKNERVSSYYLYKRYERYEKEFSADNLAELGHIYTSIRPSVESVKYFTQSLEKDSVNYAALFGMGRLMLDIGKYDLAEPYFKKIISHHPDKPISDVAKKQIEQINKIKNKTGSSDNALR